ncbi:MAG: hypothetical protein ACE5IT_05175 [bacterium]
MLWEKGPVLEQKPKQVIRLIGGMKLASFMTLSEKKFRNFIKETENSSLFKELISTNTNNFKKDRVIKYQRLPWSSLSSSFYELREDIFADKSSLDIQSLLSAKEDAVQTIRNLGIDKFKKYFLSEIPVLDSEIVAECSLSVEEIKKIRDLIDEIFIQTEFHQHPVYDRVNEIYYTKIASIEKDGKGGYTIGYSIFNLYRGRYVIDYGKIEELKKQGFFTEREKEELGTLLWNLGLINNRKKVLHHILEGIIKYQRTYLDSENPFDLKPLTQKYLAINMGLQPSYVCRIIRYKSVELPCGEEKPLKFFFPRRKEIVKGLIKEIIEKERIPKSDQRVRDELREKFGINISRLLVALYRGEMKIPSIYVRKNGKKYND